MQITVGNMNNGISNSEFIVNPRWEYRIKMYVSAAEDNKDEVDENEIRDHKNTSASREMNLLIDPSRCPNKIKSIVI